MATTRSPAGTMILKVQGWLRPENLALDTVAHGAGVAIGHTEDSEPGMT